MQDHIPKMLTVQELADRWKVDRATIYRLCQREALQHVRLGGAIRISLDAADEYLARNTVPASDALSV